MANRQSEDQQFLNRTALFTEGNAWHSSPIRAMEHVFSLENKGHLITRWKQYSQTALRQSRDFNGDCAGCIDYFERIELLVESAYLLHVNSKEERVFSHFFDALSLGAWKKALECWRNACIANHSVVDSIDPGFILVIYNDIIQLMEDSWRWYVENADDLLHLEESYVHYELYPAA